MNYMRYIMVVVGALTLLLGLAFAFHIPLATSIWPWPDGKLSYLFIGSILAAVSAAMLWIGWTGEWGALPAGSLNVLVIAATTSGYFILQSGQGRLELITYGLAGILAVAASIIAFLWSRKIPLSDERPTPVLVRVSFVVFILSLVVAGTAMVLRLPIFPWEVNRIPL